MDARQELAALIRARFPIITVDTPEEQRFLPLIENIANLEDRTLFIWSVAQGLRKYPATSSTSFMQKTNELMDVLWHIYKSDENGVYLMCDAHPYLEDPRAVRLLRELTQTGGSTQRTFVLVGADMKLPPDLQRISTSFTLPLMNADEIRTLFKSEIDIWRDNNHGQTLGGERKALDLMVQHMVGMARDDARRLIRQAIEHDSEITMEDVARVLRHKYDALGGAGVLSVVSEAQSFDQVGGQASFKQWLTRRYDAFIGNPSAQHLDVPKGALLLGVQGGGKSLAAKALAGTWGVPLLRLDFGALYNKFHGETERNLRNALDTATAMQPCVLWMDEIEKGVSSSSSDSDGGVSRRVLGTLLTWMSDKKSRVFLMATANDISQLPPELLRKGRFDEIFFVDLPLPEVRQTIFQIHLKKRKYDPVSYDVAALVDASHGFAGAEIEQAIISASYEAHAQQAAMTTDHIVNELKRTKPLSVLRAEEIAELRDWASERTVSAD